MGSLSKNFYDNWYTNFIGKCTEEYIKQKNEYVKKNNFEVGELVYFSFQRKVDTEEFEKEKCLYNLFEINMPKKYINSKSSFIDKAMKYDSTIVEIKDLSPRFPFIYVENSSAVFPVLFDEIKKIYKSKYCFEDRELILTRNESNNVWVLSSFYDYSSLCVGYKLFESRVKSYSNDTFKYNKHLMARPYKGNEHLLLHNTKIELDDYPYYVMKDE